MQRRGALVLGIQPDGLEADELASYHGFLKKTSTPDPVGKWKDSRSGSLHLPFGSIVSRDLILILRVTIHPLGVGFSNAPLASKTKEVIIDFRKTRGEHACTYINGIEVER
eukprot:g39939.t1